EVTFSGPGLSNFIESQKEALRQKVGKLQAVSETEVGRGPVATATSRKRPRMAELGCSEIFRFERRCLSEPGFPQLKLQYEGTSTRDLFNYELLFKVH
ncbi:unnamed protein product, partial [Effrenium voratum]